MEETILGTFDDVKFIQGVTKMNQPNWQAYFGTAIPNGIYKGLMVENHPEYTSDPDHLRFLTDGVVFVNGLVAELKTEEGYTDIGTAYEQGANDRFTCLRVWFYQEKVEIVQKTGIAAEPTTGETWDGNTLSELEHFLQQEDYCCERNELYWDVPILYETAYSDTHITKGRSLRRVIDPSHKRQLDPNFHGYSTSHPSSTLISGNNFYIAPTADGTVKVYMDHLDMPDGAIYRLYGQGPFTIRLQKNTWTNDALSINPPRHPTISFIFDNPEDWTYSGTVGFDYSYTATAGDYLFLKFTTLMDNPYYIVKVEMTHDYH